LEQLFGRMGYEPCDAPDLEQDFQKVALYGDGNGVLHVARQDDDGSWLSKMGEAADIVHGDVRMVEGRMIGKVLRVLKRSVRA
jgi:hypothetical protein